MLFVWFGVYNIAATEKHWSLTTKLLEMVKERSIQVRLRISLNRIHYRRDTWPKALKVMQRCASSAIWLP